VPLDPHGVKHLQLVPGTGELVELDDCPSCLEYERDLRRKNAQLNEMRRDRQAKAQRSEIWPVAVDLFKYWQVRCGHKRSKWTLERFEQIEPLLKSHGEELCRLAIEGAAFDAFTTERKNGTLKRHDDWELIFRNADKLEDFVKRAPRPNRHDPDPYALTEAQDGIAELLRDQASRIANAGTPREIALAMQETQRTIGEHGLTMRAAFIDREPEGEIELCESCGGEIRPGEDREVVYGALWCAACAEGAA
jgi:hypothetical protein